MDDEDDGLPSKKKSEVATPRRRPKRIIIPRRERSIVMPERQIVYTTADKLTCAECECFPKDIYEVPKKLNPCQKTPLTLYELASEVVDDLPLPTAFKWGEEEVADWMAEVVGLPEYRECIFDNYINGLRLIMLEDPSHLPQINIRDFNHIMIITDNVRKLYTLEFILFARSIGLPPRKPLTHCTWFKSRTGPSWGIRQNWTRSDVLRWMKILMPAPVYRDHWDLVWYWKPDFPKVMFARIAKPTLERVPRYKPPEREICREYTVPRKFRLQMGIPEEAQLIWMERAPEPPEPPKKKKKSKKRARIITKDTRLYPKKVSLAGLKGQDLVLARRKMARPKFFPSDVLRWMKILMPAPVYRDHWDLVWYWKPDFPKVMFARIAKPTLERVPRYKPPEREICREYTVPRKFRLQMGIPEEAQLIWMERAPEPPEPPKKKKKSKKRARIITKDTRLYPKKVSLAGLKGQDLVLARRKMARPKFFP